VVLGVRGKGCRVCYTSPSLQENVAVLQHTAMHCAVPCTLSTFIARKCAMLLPPVLLLQQAGHAVGVWTGTCTICSGVCRCFCHTAAVDKGSLRALACFDSTTSADTRCVHVAAHCRSTTQKLHSSTKMLQRDVWQCKHYTHTQVHIWVLQSPPKWRLHLLMPNVRATQTSM
jgi:hypothetical protein